MNPWVSGCVICLHVGILTYMKAGVDSKAQGPKKMGFQRVAKSAISRTSGLWFDLWSAQEELIMSIYRRLGNTFVMALSVKDGLWFTASGFDFWCIVLHMDLNGRIIHDVDKQSESLVYRHPCKATPDHCLVWCDKTADSVLRYS